MYKFYNKYLGLMFRNLKDNEVAVLKFKKEGYYPIHTFFVFYPIDVLWLNDKKKVVYIKRNIKPFNLKVSPNKKSKYILEFKAGFSKNMKTEQRINFYNNKK